MGCTICLYTPFVCSIFFEQVILYKFIVFQKDYGIGELDNERSKYRNIERRLQKILNISISTIFAMFFIYVGCFIYFSLHKTENKIHEIKIITACFLGFLSVYFWLCVIVFSYFSASYLFAMKKYQHYEY